MKYDGINLSFTIGSFTLHIMRVSFGRISRVIPMHSHGEGCYEIHYIASGRGDFILDGKRHEAAPDMLFIAGPLAYHEQLPDENDPMTEYCINVRIEPEGTPRDPTPPLRSDVRASLQAQDAGTVMELIYREFGRADNVSRLAVAGLMQYLFVLLSRLQSEPDTLFNAPHINQKTVYFCMIEDAIMFEYGSLTLDELASRLKLSARQTERLLKKNYGSTFRQMKTRARMAAAAAELLSTDKSVLRIAEEAGYTSTEHFRRAFKEFYNVTVSEYRRGYNKSKAQNEPEI